jgi:hypothetical protein
MVQYFSQYDFLRIQSDGRDGRDGLDEDCDLSMAPKQKGDRIASIPLRFMIDV